jgi:ABC-type nitrate/sulfonate/bicarbonate transport system substrate-binding protein
MTNFRALCAELLDALQGYVEYAPVIDEDEQQLVANARAALARLEPAAPTDEELLNELERMAEEYRLPGYWLDGEPDQYLAMWARRVLARWGQA